MATAVIYARKSAKDDPGLPSVAEQTARAQAYAATRGWDVVATYADNVGASRFTVKGRPEWDALAAYAATHPIDHLIVRDTDRITRQLHELMPVLDQWGIVTVAEYDGAEYPTGTFDGRLLLAIKTLGAEHEAAKISRNSSEGQARIARDGHPGGGGRPFGYAGDKTTIERAEADAIATAASAVLDGASLREIAATWNSAGLTTARGNEFSAPAVRHILLNPRYTGNRYHRGELAKRDAWPAIIDETTHHRLAATLRDPARRKQRTRRTNWLAGIVRCSECGSTMLGRRSSYKTADGTRTYYRRYVCASRPGRPGCGTMSINADYLENHIAHTAILPALTDSRAWASDEDDTTTAALEAIEAIDHRLGVLDTRWSAGDLDDIRWKALTDKLATDRRHHQAALTRPEPEGIPEEAAELWPHMTVAERNDLARLLLADVTISRSATTGRQGFDATRVKVTYTKV